MKKTVVQYNAVIDIDLFYTIYDWMRCHPDTLKQEYDVVTMHDFDNLSLQSWKSLAEEAIFWLEQRQLKNVAYLCPEFDGAPSLDTWGTLYYQTLAYMNIAHSWEPSFRLRSAEDQLNLCKECIEYLRNKVNEIREPNDNDI